MALQNPGLSERLTQELIAEGYSYALCRFYSTAIKSDELPKLSRLLRRTPVFSTILLRTRFAKKTPANADSIRKHYIDGELKLVAESPGRTLHGDYLVLVHPMYDDNSQDHLVFLDIVAGYIQISYGSLAVEDLHFEALYDLKNNTSSNWAHATANPSMIRLWEDAQKGFIKDSDAIRLKGRTAELAASAQSSTDPTVRFILYWLAIESEIGGGPGPPQACERNSKQQNY